jgi:hypothetical protein
MDAKVLEIQDMKGEWESMKARMEERTGVLENKNENLTRHKQILERELEACEVEKRSWIEHAGDDDQSGLRGDLERISEENMGILQQNASLRKEKALLLRQMTLRMEDLFASEEEIDRLKAELGMKRTDQGTLLADTSRNGGQHEYTQTDQEEYILPLKELCMIHTIGVQCEVDDEVDDEVDHQEVEYEGDDDDDEDEKEDAGEMLTKIRECEPDHVASSNGNPVEWISVSTCTDEMGIDDVVVLSKEQREESIRTHDSCKQLEDRVKENEIIISQLRESALLMEKETKVRTQVHLFV